MKDAYRLKAHLLSIVILMSFSSLQIVAQDMNINNTTILTTNGIELYENNDPIVSPSDGSDVLISETAEVDFKSGIQVRLNPGFRATEFIDDGKFHAYIEPSEAALVCTELNFCHSNIACTGKEVSFIDQSVGCTDLSLFIWDYGDGTASSSSPVHVFASEGTYIVTLTIPASYDHIEQTITSVIHIVDDCLDPCVIPPVITIAATKESVCDGESSTLTASGGQTYTWAPATGLDVTTGTSVVATPAVTTTYIVTATTELGCVNTQEVTITVNELPVITVSDPSPICAGGLLLIEAAGAETYSWSPSDNLNTMSGAMVRSTPTENITYTVTGTNIEGCTNTNTVSVQIIANCGEACGTLVSTED